MNTQSGVNPFAGLARARAAAEERVERFDRITSAVLELQRAVKAMDGAVPTPCVEAYAKFANDVAKIGESEKLLAPLRPALHDEAVAARTLHLAADPRISLSAVTAALSEAGLSAAKRTSSAQVRGYSYTSARGYRCSQWSPSIVRVEHAMREGDPPDGDYIERYRRAIETAGFNCGEIESGYYFFARSRGDQG